MNRATASSISDVELIIFVVEGTHWTADDDMVLHKVKQTGRPVLLVINKVDQVKEKEELFPHLQWLGEQADFVAILPVSATQAKNIDLIKDQVRKYLQPSEFIFPEDYVTDRSTRFLAAEIVREKLMRFMGEELPYSVTVEIEQFKWQENGVWHINALILVERESQKRMVIGNKGEKLKVIGREARKDMEEMLDNKVFLELWVKVKSGWADDERALRSLGYGED
jgi:GTP-binding protein Era